MPDEEDVLDNEEEALGSEDEATDDVDEPEPEPEIESKEPPKAGGAKSPLPMIIIGIVVGLVIGLLVGMLMGGSDDLQSDVDDLEDQVDQLEADLTSKDTEISDLQSNITDNQAQISQLQGEVSEEQAKLSENITRLGHANENITMLQGNITTLNANIGSLNENITSMQNENDVLMLEADMREPHIVHLQSPFLDIECADCHNVDSQGTVITREDYMYDDSDLTDWTFRREVNAEDCAHCHGPFPTEGVPMTDDYMNVTYLVENDQTCVTASTCHGTGSFYWQDGMSSADVDLTYIDDELSGADTESIVETCMTCHGGQQWYEEHP